MAGFNRTLSPQGDGNLKEGLANSAVGYVCSTEPFPRKGTETYWWHPSSQALHSVQQNPFPARGRKLHPASEAGILSCCLFNRTLSPQGDGNPVIVKVPSFIFSWFNRTLSPQGDGNSENPNSVGGPIALFNRTLSPQGDGNQLRKTYFYVSEVMFNRTLSPQGDGN